MKNNPKYNNHYLKVPEKIEFKKLNKDKFDKQILTHPHSNTKNIGLQYAVQHQLMLSNTITINIYKLY